MNDEEIMLETRCGCTQFTSVPKDTKTITTSWIINTPFSEGGFPITQEFARTFKDNGKSKDDMRILEEVCNFDNQRR